MKVWKQRAQNELVVWNTITSVYTFRELLPGLYYVSYLKTTVEPIKSGDILHNGIYGVL